MSNDMINYFHIMSRKEFVEDRESSLQLREGIGEGGRTGSKEEV